MGFRLGINHTEASKQKLETWKYAGVCKVDMACGLVILDTVCKDPSITLWCKSSVRESGASQFQSCST